MLPIARTEPLCFCHVDGCSQPGAQMHGDQETGAGGAKMAVGDEAASCELKASDALPVTRAHT